MPVARHSSSRLAGIGRRAATATISPRSAPARSTSLGCGRDRRLARRVGGSAASGSASCGLGHRDRADRRSRPAGRLTVADSDQGLGSRTGLGRSNIRCDKRSTEQQRRTNRLNHLNRINLRYTGRMRTRNSMRLLPHGPSAICRLAWHFLAVSSQENAPRSCCCSAVSGQIVTGSSPRGRFSDEPFGVRDIQFDRPQILVESCPFGEEIRNFRGFGRFGRARPAPSIVAVEVENPLEAGEVPAARADQQEQRPALLVALAEDGREIAVGLGPAQDRRRLRDASEAGRSRRAASGGVALIGPEQHRGQRIAAARAAHLLERRAVADDPADRGQRLQMLGAGIGRRQQQEDEVDLAPVDRLVIDRLGEPREQAVDPLEPLDLAVRDRNALAEAGASRAFRARSGWRGSPPARRRSRWPARFASCCSKRALAAAGKGGLDRVEIDEIGKLHERTRERNGRANGATPTGDGLSGPAARPSRCSRPRGGRSCCTRRSRCS